MPTLEEQIEMRAGIIEREVSEEFGLHELLSTSYGLVAAAIEILLEQPAPGIVRGLVSAERQRELFRLWLAGDPRVTFRPAARSWHLLGRAIDLRKGSPTFDAFRVGWAVVTRGFGRDGASFGDLGHFDVPGDQLPPAAFIE